MTREEAISEWTFRSNYIKKWLDEYGEEPSIRHYVELIDMAIEALSTEAVQGVGRYENAMQKLRDMPRYLNGVKEKQITKVSANNIKKKPNDIVEQKNDIVVEQTELIKDGTLKVKTKNGAEVKRVLVWGGDGCGGLYYKDGDTR